MGKKPARMFREGTLTHFEAEVKKLFKDSPVGIDLKFEAGDGHVVVSTPSVEWIDETFCKSGDSLLYPFNKLCIQFTVDYRLAGKDIIVGDGIDYSW